MAVPGWLYDPKRLTYKIKDVKVMDDYLSANSAKTLADIAEARVAEMNDLLAIVAEPNPSAYSFSDTQFEIIRKYVLDFQASLDEEHDIGLLLTNFGQTMLMEVTQIGFERSVLMVFRGYVHGRQSTLIQHISQLSFLLTSVPKDPNAPKRKIGFNANWAEQ